MRLLRPELVVETGVEKGLGTCVLAAALLRNQEEGGPSGRVVAIDIKKGTGGLVGPPYNKVVELVIDSSERVMERLEKPIGLFIHDSDHRYEYETRELEQARKRLAAGGLLLSDNAYASTALMDFAERAGGRYFFWSERPENHFYRGGGLGVAVLDNRAAGPPARPESHT